MLLQPISVESVTRCLVEEPAAPAAAAPAAEQPASDDVVCCLSTHLCVCADGCVSSWLVSMVTQCRRSSSHSCVTGLLQMGDRVRMPWEAASKLM